MVVLVVGVFAVVVLVLVVVVILLIPLVLLILLVFVCVAIASCRCSQPQSAPRANRLQGQIVSHFRPVFENDLKDHHICPVFFVASGVLSPQGIGYTNGFLFHDLAKMF